MAVTRRSRTVPAPPAAVWDVVGDPHHLPRWWPRVERVEAVDGRGFTELLRSDKGAIVRADFRIGQRLRPKRITWTQDVEGTPFERLLRSAETIVELEDDGAGGTRVALTLDQKLQGISRLGAFLVRRAARRTLDEALKALAGLHAGA